MQSTVQFFQGTGKVGDLYIDNPRIVNPINVDSEGGNNVIGYAYTYSDEGTCQVGGSGAFAGILIASDSYELTGSDGDPLSPSLVLANNKSGEFLVSGCPFVNLETSTTIGDSIIYEVATGKLSAIAPDAALPSGYLPAYARSAYFNTSGAGLAVISVNYTPPVNVPAV